MTLPGSNRQGIPESTRVRYESKFARGAAKLARASNASGIVAVGRLGSMAMSLVSAPIIARGLGPDGRGTSAAVLALVGIAPVLLGLGIPLAARRRIASGHPARDVVATARIIASTMALPAVFLAWLVERVAFPDLDSAERIAYYASMACVPLSISWATDVSVMIVARQFRRMAILGLLNSAAALAATLSVWLFSTLTVAAVIYASLAANIATFLIAACWVPVRGGRIREFRATFREGISLTGGQLAEVASKRIDQVIALPIMGAVATGLYSVAVTVGLLLIPVGHALGAATFVALTQDVSRSLRLQFMRYAAALSTFGGGCLALIAWIGIPVVFGQDYSAARPAALVTILGTAVACIGMQASMMLTIDRRGYALSTAQVVGGIVGLGTLVPCAMAWGPIGAAWATAGGSAVATCTMLALLRIRPWAIAPRPRDAVRALRLLVKPQSSD